MDLTSYAYLKAAKFSLRPRMALPSLVRPSGLAWMALATPPATPPAATVTGELQLPLPLFLIFD